MGARRGGGAAWGLGAGLLLLAGCEPAFPSRAVVACHHAFDGALVGTDWTRAHYPVGDTLALPTVYEPFDPADCQRIVVPSAGEDGEPAEGCDLGDVVIAFTLRKRAGSDTLFVRKWGEEVAFRIPEGPCNAGAP